MWDPIKELQLTQAQPNRLLYPTHFQHEYIFEMNVTLDRRHRRNIVDHVTSKETWKL